MVVTVFALAWAAVPITSPALADSGQRAYELVSPPEKNGADVSLQTSLLVSSSDGERVAYASNGGFADTQANDFVSQYLAARLPDGWQTHGITPPQQPDPFEQVAPTQFEAFSADLSGGILLAGEPALTSEPPGEFKDLYRRMFADPVGAYTLLSPSVNPPFFGVPRFAGSSTDLRHVVFETSAALTPDAPNDFNSHLYEFSPEGLEYVGILPDGTAATDGSVAGRGAANTYTARAVSDDGSRIVFTTGGGFSGGHLYMHVTGSTTLDVSGSRRATPDPAGPQPATFETAANDESKVFFSSGEKLTDDATAAPGAEDLYVYEPATYDIHDLTSQDPSGAGLQAVLGASVDGSHVYFVATGNLAAGASPGQPNVFIWQEGVGVRFVATLTNADFENTDPFFTAASRSSRVTPNGQFLVFTSTGRQTAYDNAGHNELYVYDAETRGLACASCRPDGRPPSTDVSVSSHPSSATGSSQYLPRIVTDDGARVFFNTAEDLVPEDTNGKVDVYEFEGGKPKLISTGRGNSDAVFGDASANGDDVFFVTRDRLVGWDQDNNLDVYDARVGGGFPEPPSASPGCQGSNCQGALRSPLAVPFSASEQFTGPSRVHSAVARFTVAKPTARQRAEAARTGVLLISVTVNRAGKISVTLRAKIGKHGSLRLVASGSRTVHRGGRIRTRLRLSTAARAFLARHGEITLAMRVSFGPVPRAKTVRVTLRRAVSAIRVSAASPANHRRARS